MTQNHLFLIIFITKYWPIIFLIELFVFYLFAYLIVKLNRAVNKKIMIIEELIPQVAAYVKVPRVFLEKFNLECEKTSYNSGLTLKEAKFLFGSVFASLIKLKLAPLNKNRILILSGIILNLWKYRKKIMCTILNFKLNSV